MLGIVLSTSLALSPYNFHSGPGRQRVFSRPSYRRENRVSEKERDSPEVTQSASRGTGPRIEENLILKSTLFATMLCESLSLFWFFICISFKRVFDVLADLYAFSSGWKKRNG